MDQYSPPVEAKPLPLAAGQREIHKGFSTNASSPGETLEKPLLPGRLNGTDTKSGKGSGADEKRMKGIRSATLGNMSSHLQAQKSKPHLLAGL